MAKSSRGGGRGSGGGGGHIPRNEQARVRRWHNRREDQRPVATKNSVGERFMAGVHKRKAKIRELRANIKTIEQRQNGANGGNA